MITSKLAEVRHTITEAARRSGREGGAVTVVAVTKTRSRDVIDEAIRAGISIFGENRVQEARAKYADIASRVELHLVGHLQSNKAKLVPGLFSWVDSVDSIGTAEALSRRFQQSGLRCNVLLQYNCSGESTKSGYEREDDLLEEAEVIAALPALTLRGVMTIGPFTPDSAPIREAFARTRRLYEKLRERIGGGQIDTLSMGMSDDYAIAVEEGSTQVRLGTVLFGPRDAGPGVT
jgi:pyridoxal phosphate enzyme (YggS family)